MKLFEKMSFGKLVGRKSFLKVLLYKISRIAYPTIYKIREHSPLYSVNYFCRWTTIIFADSYITNLSFGPLARPSSAAVLNVHQRTILGISNNLFISSLSLAAKIILELLRLGISSAIYEPIRKLVCPPTS